jgi:hypothetical protein
MARRLIDSVTGIGSVQAGNHTLRATRYRLSFWANDDLPQPSDAADTAPRSMATSTFQGLARPQCCPAPTP